MKFKGKSFIAIVMSPEQPYEDWFVEIDRIIARTPGFFIDRPIILDVRGKKIPIADLEALLDGFSQRSIRVMGIDGVAGTRLKSGMPPSFSGGRLTADVDVPEPVEPQEASPRQSDAGETAEPADVSADTGPDDAQETPVRSQEPKWVTAGPPDGSSMVVTETVRSGQSVMHPKGDVTVIGSVSSGAEIIAGGSIHVYGALRGRAMAGVAGNDNARIFCSRLDAELVSINGLYKVADDFDGSLLNAPAQIRFENDALVFEGLN